MTSSDQVPTLGGLPASIGTLEFNVLVAGAGALPWMLLLRATIWNVEVLPPLPEKWLWWYAPAGILAVVGLFLLGLAIEGVAGLLENGLAWSAKRQPRFFGWYSPAAYDAKTWRNAQAWTWQSSQAAAELGRRRLRILVARNTAVNLLLLTFGCGVFLFVRRPANWILCSAGMLVGGFLVFLFSYVWINAAGAFRRAVEDAGEVKGAR